MEADSRNTSAVSEAPPVLRYKQRLEKASGGEAVLMEWSPTMDLLALALADHSVALHRLTWQRVWVFGPGSEAVTAMAWRPDGRVLAVGHSDGSVGLHDVENGNLLNSFTSSNAARISCLHWANLGQLQENNEKESLYEEVWSQYLPPLPSVESREKTYPDDPKKLQPTDSLKSLHVLLIGDALGQVHMCLLGVFLITVLHPESVRGHVMLSWMSEDFKQVYNLALKPEPPYTNANPTLLVSGVNLLSKRASELHHMAILFGRVSCYLEYMSATLKAMSEAWDDLLFNLDSQLAGYSETLPEGRSVRDELLVLLACGRASQKLQTFLTSELTAKGVKKLGLSLEHSYENIRKFLLHHFHGGLQGLHLLLAGALGVARWKHQFGELGLSESAVQGCINLSGTLALKAQEMLQAIDHSLQSIKVFFLWLYVVILKLSKEPIPKGLKEDLTPDELKLVIDFLKKRLSKAKHGKHAFNLETVGQYLNNEDLKYVEERPSSFWEQLMETSQLTTPPSSDPTHSDTSTNDTPNSTPSSSIPWLFHPSPTKSLMQLFQTLHSSVNEAFSTPMATIFKTVTTDVNTKIPSSLSRVTGSQVSPLMCRFEYDDTCFVCLPQSMETADIGKGRTVRYCEFIGVLTYPRNRRGNFRKHTFCIRTVDGLPEKPEEQLCTIVSLRCYNEESLSILFQYSFKAPKDPTSSSTDESNMVVVTHSVLAQLPMAAVKINNDVGPHLTQVHNLGSFKAKGLAVSGARKVAAVVSGNGKKVRVFDVDTEEDTDE